MRRGSPFAFIATLSCLLAVATSASGECAWVLWVSSAHASEPSRWMTTRAFVTRQDCVAAAQAAFKPYKDAPRTEGSVQRMVVTEEPADGSFLVTTNVGASMVSTAIKCLPDTIDPRGPKGK